MTTGVMIQTKKVNATTTDQDFNMAERLTLMLYHPTAIFIEMAGLVWSAYYFWNYDWKMALATFLMTMVTALLTGLNLNLQKMSETTLGKIGLLHLHPMNITVRLFGAALLFYGVWERSLEITLGGLSVTFLGHTFGWSKVSLGFTRNVEP